MVLFRRCRNGFVDGQHGRIPPVEGICQAGKLLQHRLEDDSLVGFQLVVHPQEGGVDALLTDSAVGTAAGL